MRDVETAFKTSKTVRPQVNHSFKPFTKFLWFILYITRFTNFFKVCLFLISWHDTININYNIYLLLSYSQEQARIHYNCSTIEGVELENQGGGGTSYAHFEQRILGVSVKTKSL